MRKWIPVLPVVVLLGSACAGPSGQTGSLTVNLKDGPYADAQAMLVTFKSVSAHHTDAEWQPLAFAGSATTLTCDLKKLVNVFDRTRYGAITRWALHAVARGGSERGAIQLANTTGRSRVRGEHDAACRPHWQRRDPIGRSEAQSTIHDTGGRGNEDPPRLRWRSLGERDGQRSLQHVAGHQHRQRRVGCASARSGTSSSQAR